MMQILTHTPAWIWGVLALLFIMGRRATQDRVMGLNQLLILPLAMLALAVSGMLKHFNQPVVWACWLLGMAIAAALVWKSGKPELARFNAEDKTVAMKGSYWPLFLMLGIFLSKYCAEVMMAMNPSLAQQSSFAIAVALVYGLFNGFMFRTLLRVAMQWQRPLQAY